MTRLLAVLTVLIAAGCAGHHSAVAPKTRLTVRVTANRSAARYTLTCRPAGGSAPDPARACRALEDFLPRREAGRAVCLCAVYLKSITVRGVLDGRRLS